MLLCLLAAWPLAGSPPPATPGLFGPATTYAVGYQPRALALADVNGDGRLDIITANEAKTRALPGGGDNYAIGVGALLPRLSRRAKDKDVGSVSVLLGQPNGSFAAARSYPVGRYPTSVAVADLNQDGHPDIVTADANFMQGYTLTVLAGQADGSFAAAQAVPGSYLRTPEALVLADLTGDGRPDAISVGDLPGTGGASVGTGVQVQPALAAPAVGFGPPAQYPTRHYSPRSLALADVTGDGRPDAIVTEGHGYSPDSAVLVLPGLAHGRFGAPLEYPSEHGPTAVADVNNDGRPDLVAVSAYASSVRLAGRAGLGPATRYAGLGELPITAVLADVTGDGRPDLLTNHYTYAARAVGRVAVRPGLAAGGWGPATTYSVGTNSAERFALADLNGDGRPDLVTLNRNTSTVSVLLAR